MFLKQQFFVPLLEGLGELNPLDVFPGKVVKIDEPFRDLLGNGEYTICADNVFCVYQTEAGESVDDVIFRSVSTIGVSLHREHICAFLVYLATDEGAKLLVIPEGQDEVNIILGYTNDLVFFVEHEMEHGVEEFHLHARPRNRWKEPYPMVIAWNG